MYAGNKKLVFNSASQVQKKRKGGFQMKNQDKDKEIDKEIDKD